MTLYIIQRTVNTWSDCFLLGSLRMRQFSLIGKNKLYSISTINGFFRLDCFDKLVLKKRMLLTCYCICLQQPQIFLFMCFNASTPRSWAFNNIYNIYRNIYNNLYYNWLYSSIIFFLTIALCWIYPIQSSKICTDITWSFTPELMSNIFRLFTGLMFY